LDDKSNVLMDTALRLAAQGRAVLPCHGIVDGKCTCGDCGCESPGKHPRTPNGVKAATKDLEQIRLWWLEHPDSNLAIACGLPSGLLVLDVDGVEGEVALRALNLDLPATLEVTTGREGGRHIYFAVPDGAPSRTFGKHLSARGNGHYVISPPSLHVSGKRYRWANGLSPIMPAPDVLLQVLKTTAQVVSIENRSASDQTDGHISDGTRKRTLLRMAMAMAREGHGRANIEVVLLDVNQRRCDPPLPEREVRRVVNKAGEYVARQQQTSGLAAPSQISVVSVDGAVVDGAMLVRDVGAFYSRFLVLPQSTALPLAVWTIGTYCFDIFDAFPYVTLTSPSPRCGKTRVLEVAELVVQAPLRATNTSEAALFRAIDKFKPTPTLLLDEAETLRSKGERADYLLQVINAGNRRNAHVLRCDGKPPRVEKFQVYCPKVIAQIGTPPTTILDRSIVIAMQRRKPDEQVGRFLLRSAGPEGRDLGAKAAAWTNAHHPEIERAYQEEPLEFLSDRDAECWQPLFSVLAVADAVRLPELQTCAEALTGSKTATAEDDSLPLKLLVDIKMVFELGSTDRLSSIDLCERLRQDETAPWIEFDHGKPLTQRGLARMVGRFGVAPRVIRLADGSTPRGYLKSSFSDAWERYLPVPHGRSSLSPRTSPYPQQPQQANNHADVSSKSHAQHNSLVADQKSEGPSLPTRVVALVADTTHAHEEARSTKNASSEASTLRDWREVPRIPVDSNKIPGPPAGLYRREPLSEGREECGGENDPLYGQAVQVTHAHDEISISLLKEQLGIASPRAVQLMDLLEQCGIVGPAHGPGPRKVLKRTDPVGLPPESAPLAGATPDRYYPEPLPGGGWRCECGAEGNDPVEWSKHTGKNGCPLKASSFYKTPKQSFGKPRRADRREARP
jgi:hypothetical protein